MIGVGIVILTEAILVPLLELVFRQLLVFQSLYFCPLDGFAVSRELQQLAHIFFEKTQKIEQPLVAEAKFFLCREVLLEYRVADLVLKNNDACVGQTLDEVDGELLGHADGQVLSALVRARRRTRIDQVLDVAIIDNSWGW